MKKTNIILYILACLLQFHGVRSGSSDTCQLIDFGGVNPYQIGLSTFSTPFTQDKSTLYSFLSTQVITFIDQNAVDILTYTGVNFHLIADDPAQPQQGNMPYGHNWFTNITIGFNSWFTPLESGEYTFSIDTASDAAAIYIYDNQDMMCCDDLNFASWLPQAIDVINIPTDPEHTTGPKSATLEAGKNYLLIIMYINFSGDAELSISITDPSGLPITDLGPYMTYPIAPTCDFVRKTSMIYSLGTDSVTSTYSTSYRTTSYINPGGEIFVTELETIYYILTPPVPSSSEIVPSSSDILSSSSSELLTSYDSSVIESSSEIITSSSEGMTSNDQSSSSEVTLSTSAVESSTSNSGISSSEISSHSSSDELPTSSVTSYSEGSEATTDMSTPSAEYSSGFSDDVTSSFSSEDAGTNDLFPASSSNILSEYSTGRTSKVASATISDGPEDIKTTVSGGSIYINSTTGSHSSTVESSRNYYGSSSGLTSESSSTKELDDNGIRPTHSAGGSAAYTVVRTVTNILGQTTTTVVTCTENVCQTTDRPNEEHDEPKSSAHGGNTVTLSPVVTEDAPVATSKQIGVETNVPQTELSSTGKYEGTEVLQVGSNSASSAPTTTLSVVVAPNGSVRIQKCLITSVFSFILMVLLL